MLIDLLNNALSKDSGAPVSGGYDGPFVSVNRNNNTIIHSEDGLDWVSKTAPAPSVGIAYGDGKYVIICTDRKIYSSPDLINWTHEFTTGNDLRAIAYGNGRFSVICDGHNSFMVKLDGGGWTFVNNGFKVDAQLVKLRFLNGYFIACFDNSGQYAMSSDGVNWGRAAYYNGMGNTTDVAYGDGKFVLATNYGVRIGPDITNMPPSVGNYIDRNIGSVLTGNGLIIVSITGYGHIYTSTDGKGWTQRGTTWHSNKTGVYRKGIFLFGDENGRIGRSTDGLVWSDIQSAFRSSNANIGQIL